MLEGAHRRWGHFPALAVCTRHLLEVMALIVIGGTGRGQRDWIDDSGGILFYVRAIVTNFPVIQADASFRRNPVWYTFGHLSLLYGDFTVIWETWINYPDQTFEMTSTFYTFLQSGAEQLGLPAQLYQSDGTPAIDLTFRWQMRGEAAIDVYVAT